MRIKALLVALLSMAVIFSTGQTAAAAPITEPPNKHGQTQRLHKSRSLQQNLQAEGLETTKAVVDTSAIELDGHAAAPTDAFSYELDLRSTDQGVKGVFHVRDTVDGQESQAVYDVAVSEATEKRVVFTLTDRATGESHSYDSANPQQSIAFAIPIGLAAISVGTLLYYLAIGAAIIVGLYIAVEAAKAVPRLLEDWRRYRRYKHYAAYRSGSKLFIGKHLTSAQAQSRGRAGGDVWSVTRTYAKDLAKVLNRSGVPQHHAPHGSGYLWHYHPYRHVPNMHSFYS